MFAIAAATGGENRRECLTYFEQAEDDQVDEVDEVEEFEEEVNNSQENEQIEEKEKISVLKKANKLTIKYPLRKIIDFKSAKSSQLRKVFNLLVKDVLNIGPLFPKKMLVPDKQIEINLLIDSLIDFNYNKIKDTINKKGFYKDKVKPFLILYGSSCYDLIKLEKVIKGALTKNIVLLKFFGKHKKFQDEVSKTKDLFNKTKMTENTFYVILTTPNRMLKLAKEKLFDFTFLHYNVLDLTPNVKNLTFLDMKDCRTDFFNFIKDYLKDTPNFDNTNYLTYLDKKD